MTINPITERLDIKDRSSLRRSKWAKFRQRHGLFILKK
jgi:hypothetical protein